MTEDNLFGEVKIRQIRITNYVTGKTKFKEVTPEQHIKILKEIAEKKMTIEVDLIKERKL